LNWTGHVNRMDSKRKVCQVLNNKPQGKLTDRTTKKQTVELCTQTLIDVNLKTAKRGIKKTEREI